MSENITVVEGQMDLLTGEVVEVQVSDQDVELTIEDVVTEITDTVFGEATTITPYQIHKIVNGAFEALGVVKVIPPQMMYSYSRNGLLVKGEKGIKALNKDQVTAFVNKYVSKYAK